MCVLNHLGHVQFFVTPWTLCSPPVSSVHGILQARILEWVAMPSSRGSSQPGVETRSPTVQEDSLSSQTPGKPKNTGVGSLYLLPQIFLTQKLNWGLLNHRWIIYQMSHIGRLKCICKFTRAPRCSTALALPTDSGHTDVCNKP